MVSVVVLSRLLTPQDYGLVAMVVVLTGVGELFRDLGLSSAAIQARELSWKQRDNLFWINTALGGTVTLVVASLAPVFALAYGHDALIGITLALAPTFLISGLATQYRAALSRDLRFGALAALDISCAAVGLASGIAIAVAGFGYWALVWQQLIGGTAFLIAVVAVSRWLPGRYHRDVQVGRIVRLGSSVLGSQLLVYATNNIDSLFVGARFGSRDLGYYNRGLQLVRTPMSMARTTITTVALPVLSRLQDDRPRFVRFAMRGQLAISLPILLLVSWVVAAGPDFVTALLGAQWAPATDVIRLIALGEGLSTLMIVISTIYIALGLSRQLVRFSFAVLVLKVGLLMIGLNWGILGVAAAYAAGPAIVFPLALWQVSRATDLRLRQMFFQGLEMVAIAATTCLSSIAALAVLGDMGTIANLATAALCHVIVIAALCAVPRVRTMFASLLNVARSIRAPSVAAEAPVRHP